jgi:long-chain fatty acid transport protein
MANEIVPDHLTHSRNQLLLCAVMLLGASGPLLGLGFRIPNQDAEATARGNAFVATADNPSAIYYNPAGIASQQGYQLQAGLHALSVNADYTSPSGGTSETKFGIAPVPQLYASMPLSRTPLTFGLGLYVPYGLGIEWPEDSGFRTLAIEGQLTYATLNPVVAWRVCEGLALAAGPTFNYADLEIRRGLVAPGDEFRFAGDDFAVGFTAGILWQPHPKWSFGASYRSETTMDFDGDIRIRSLVPQIPSGSASATAEMPFAQVAVAGVSFRPTPRWNFEVNIDWTDWDSMNTLMLQSAMGDLPFPLNWESSFLYEFGASHYFDSGWYLAAGYFFSENSTSELDFTPLLPDTDLHVGSLGFGYRGERWRFGLSGQLITGPARTVQDSRSASLVGESADGEYQWLNWAVNASAGYHF